jgi:hypothetical protein
MTTPPSPVGLIRVDGQFVVPRRGWVQPTEPLTCLRGHIVHENIATLHEGSGTWWCKHKASANQGECGLMIYLLVFPSGGTRRRRRWAADVTYEDMRHIEQQEMEFEQIMEYLHATFPRRECA